MCANCPSISHISCVYRNPINATYRRPSCLDPNFSFFNAAAERPTNQKTKLNDHDGESRQLVAAASIALGTMNKAKIRASLETGKRFKEAVLARKRAKEALERVAYLVSKKKEEGRTATGQMRNDIRRTHLDASVFTSIVKP